MSVLLVFHSGFGGAVEAAFPLTAVLDISTATAGSWNLFVGFFFFFPASSQINNPPSWRRARVCFETISPHGSLKHARLIKKRGETTRTVQLSSERKCSTSRAREEDGGTLNGSLFQPSNTIVFGATPIPTNHILTFTPPPPQQHFFIYLFTRSPSLSQLLTLFMEKEKTLSIHTHSFCSQRRTLRGWHCMSSCQNTPHATAVWLGAESRSAF